MSSPCERWTARARKETGKQQTRTSPQQILQYTHRTVARKARGREAAGGTTAAAASAKAVLRRASRRLPLPRGTRGGLQSPVLGSATPAAAAPAADAADAAAPESTRCGRRRGGLHVEVATAAQAAHVRRRALHVSAAHVVAGGRQYFHGTQGTVILDDASAAREPRRKGCSSAVHLLKTEGG